MKRYRARVGLNTPKGRFEVGDVVEGLPRRSIPDLLAGGYIEEIDDDDTPADDRPADDERSTT
jgi:hypothetical protein